ncbi:MAG: hypothetical protein Ct9H300mP11_08370 [Chloroflexota bacterium]|nr:MAG: hypothetical protein Ct9H300mP11_08370 [Chloroflexota bacterium]
MTSTNKDPILVVIQLTGGKDYINTVVPPPKTHSTTTTAKPLESPKTTYFQSAIIGL